MYVPDVANGFLECLCLILQMVFWSSSPTLQIVLWSAWSSKCFSDVFDFINGFLECLCLILQMVFRSAWSYKCFFSGVPMLYLTNGFLECLCLILRFFSGMYVPDLANVFFRSVCAWSCKCFFLGCLCLILRFFFLECMCLILQIFFWSVCAWSCKCFTGVLRPTLQIVVWSAWSSKWFPGVFDLTNGFLECLCLILQMVFRSAWSYKCFLFWSAYAWSYKWFSEVSVPDLANGFTPSIIPLLPSNTHTYNVSRCLLPKYNWNWISHPDLKNMLLSKCSFVGYRSRSHFEIHKWGSLNWSIRMYNIWHCISFHEISSSVALRIVSWL